MSEETWRPLGVDAEEEVAEYDALHDGVPLWMDTSFWAWVRQALIVRQRFSDNSGSATMLNTGLAESMCQTLKINFPNLRTTEPSTVQRKRQLDTALQVLRGHSAPLQIADYLLAHGEGGARPESLNETLTRSKSAFEVGTRTGLPGLTRRVPLGVQVAANSVIARSGRAGVRLAEAWELLYGLTPNPSEAYRDAAILAS